MNTLLRGQKDKRIKISLSWYPEGFKPKIPWLWCMCSSSMLQLLCAEKIPGVSKHIKSFNQNFIWVWNGADKIQVECNYDEMQNQLIWYFKRARDLLWQRLIWNHPIKSIFYYWLIKMLSFNQNVIGPLFFWKYVAGQWLNRWLTKVDKRKRIRTLNDKTKSRRFIKTVSRNLISF